MEILVSLVVLYPLSLDVVTNYRNWSAAEEILAGQTSPCHPIPFQINDELLVVVLYNSLADAAIMY
jgi:hypothetical protein